MKENTTMMPYNEDHQRALMLRAYQPGTDEHKLTRFAYATTMSWAHQMGTPPSRLLLKLALWFARAEQIGMTLGEANEMAGLDSRIQSRLALVVTRGTPVPWPDAVAVLAAFFKDQYEQRTGQPMPSSKKAAPTDA